jgi:ribosome-binding protein aMBF1 (putative translation factor)
MAKSSVMETFAKNTQAALRKKGWSIQRLATEIDMDRSDLSKVVRGMRGCTLETAMDIARAVQVPLSVLVEDFSEFLATAS